MALEKSGKLEATNLLLYIILTQCNVDIAMLHIDETPVKLVQVLKIDFGKLQLN